MTSASFRNINLGVFSYQYETAGRGPAFWGFLVLVPFLLVLFGWVALAPLSAAAIAHGAVVLNGDRKIVQHLEGGLVDEILVTEGALVEEGAPIFVIRDVSQRAQINMLYDQLASSRALRARLIAERDQLEQLNFSDLTKDINLPSEKFEELRVAQVRMFKNRKESLNTKIHLIKSRQEATKQEIMGLKRQLSAVKRQLNLTLQELVTVRSLFKKGLVTGNRFMEIQRDHAEFEGEAGQIAANIARLEQSVATSEIEVIDLRIEVRNQVLEDLQQIELTVHELTQQTSEMQDELSRTVIRAPVTGRAMDIQFQTKGAVVRPGERILDIVPLDDRLIVEARVNPNDIDLVTEGLKTKILLSAYKAKKVPKLDGEVINVSADILSDQKTGDSFFLARVLVDETILRTLKSDVKLYPGMPAQVFLLAGERTVADYLLSPILDATYRAFREE